MVSQRKGKSDEHLEEQLVPRETTAVRKGAASVPRRSKETSFPEKGPMIVEQQAVAQRKE